MHLDCHLVVLQAPLNSAAKAIFIIGLRVLLAGDSWQLDDADSTLRNALIEVVWFQRESFNCNFKHGCASCLVRVRCLYQL